MPVFQGFWVPIMAVSWFNCRHFLQMTRFNGYDAEK